MTVSVRTYLTAGVAALTASVMVVAPVQAPPSDAIASPTIQLSAAVQPLVQPVNAAAAVLGLVKDVVQPSPSRPAAALAPAPAVTAAPAPQNAASDFVISAWNFAAYWISYGATLAEYVTNFIPGLGIIGDQAVILTNTLVLPIGDSVVYGLIDPVLNDPLNLSVWVNGLATVGATTVNALVNTGIAEFNYFFGWLIPPLPPLPLPPLPGLPLTATAARSVAATPDAASIPATLLQALGERLGLRNALINEPIGDVAAGAQGLITRTEQALSNVATEVASIPAAVSKTVQGFTGAVEAKVPSDVASAPDLDPANPPALKAVVGAPREAVRAKVRDALTTEPKTLRDSVKAGPTAGGKTVRDSVSKAFDGVQKAGADVAKAVKANQPQPKKSEQDNNDQDNK
jgi:hypothetical protein